MQPPVVKNTHTFQVHTKRLLSSRVDDDYGVMLTTWPQLIIGAILVYRCNSASIVLIYFLGANPIFNARRNSFIDAYIFSFQTNTGPLILRAWSMYFETS